MLVIRKKFGYDQVKGSGRKERLSLRCCHQSTSQLHLYLWNFFKFMEVQFTLEDPFSHTNMAYFSRIFTFFSKHGRYRKKWLKYKTIQDPFQKYRNHRKYRTIAKTDLSSISLLLASFASFHRSRKIFDQSVLPLTRNRLLLS